MNLQKKINKIKIKYTNKIFKNFFFNKVKASEYKF